VTLGFEQLFQPVQVHIALERMFHFRIQSFGNHQVLRLDTGIFEVGSCRVEMRIVRHDRALAGILGHDGGQDMLRRSPLVRGDDVFEWHQVFYSIPETVIGGGTGIGFIAFHQCGPLRGAHR